MTAILGISAFYHDSAAALVIDGEIVAAAQEERFSRVKHDAGFPSRATAYCLSEAGLRSDELDYVAFYEKPLAKFDRMLETYLAHAPLGFGEFREAIPIWLKEKLHIRGRVATELGRSRRKPVVFLDHHDSHAASAFFPSPFGEAAILTLDGVGEWSTTTLGEGQGNTIRLTQHLRFPHSLGLLYSAFTAYCGFEVNDGEYKLMGLAPYGQPVYADAIRKNLIDLKPDGSFRLNMDYFGFGYARRMTNRRFERLFGGPARRLDSALEQRHADVAASVQVVLSEAVLRIAVELHRCTRQENLVLAGGVALNCVANEQLLRNGPFKKIWIQPAAGDAGGSLGAALLVWHQLLDKPRTAASDDSQRGSLLGPQSGSAAVRDFLVKERVRYDHLPKLDELNTRMARALADGKVVGWFSGRMEFGPRALGSRSILADARRPEMQSVLNQKIKFREGFRPFAPAVLAEQASDWFNLAKGQGSPYMLLTAPVAEAQRRVISPTDEVQMRSDPDLCRRAAVIRSSIPAVTHVDFSARVQSVDRTRNPLFHALLSEFYEQTGCPVLINTSFNVRGEPIVCTPEDAYRCFLATEMDFLVLEDCIIEKPPHDRRVIGDYPIRGDRRADWSSPSTRQLREFAFIGALGLFVMGIWQVLARGSTTLGSALAGLAVVAMSIGLLKPRWLSPIFTTWMIIAFPIAWSVSTLLLAIVFYSFFTPLGVWFRLIARDPLDRRFRSDQDTYWQEKTAANSNRRYFQQF
jgi:carbamoyltransferase